MRCFVYISLISFKANYYCYAHKKRQHNLMNEYIILGNGGKSRNVKSRAERTECIYQGYIYGSVSIVLRLDKEISFQKIRTECGEGSLPEGSRDGHTPWEAHLSFINFLGKIKTPCISAIPHQNLGP